MLLLLCLAAWKPALMPDGTNGEDKAIAGAAQACEEMEESPPVAGPKSVLAYGDLYDVSCDAQSSL